MDLNKEECEKILNFLSQTNIGMAVTLHGCDLVQKEIRPLLEKLTLGTQEKEKDNGPSK